MECKVCGKYPRKGEWPTSFVGVTCPDCQRQGLRQLMNEARQLDPTASSSSIHAVVQRALMTGPTASLAEGLRRTDEYEAEQARSAEAAMDPETVKCEALIPG